MKIRVDYKWVRELNSGDSWTILTAKSCSKKFVLEAIREYVRTWTGKGYLVIKEITPSFFNQDVYCDISQSNFRFNN